MADPIRAWVPKVNGRLVIHAISLLGADDARARMYGTMENGFWEKNPVIDIVRVEIREITDAK